MKTYNNIEEVKADIVDGVLKVEDDVTFTFDLDIYANIDCYNINASDIDALDIDASDINALNIKARDIDALNINAQDISYYAVCFAYKNITCKSIEGRRENSKHFCIDGAITYKDEETITIGGKKYLKDEVENTLKDIKEVK